MSVALLLGKAWPLVLVVLPWAAMNRVVIPFEEARLGEALAKTTPNIVTGCGDGSDPRSSIRVLDRLPPIMVPVKLRVQQIVFLSDRNGSRPVGR